MLYCNVDDYYTYQLKYGDYRPFSYLIGNPFVIGYWQSEVVAIPQDQAYQQLTEQYLPSPDEVVITTDRHKNTNDAYFWNSMLYARNGFE